MTEQKIKKTILIIEDDIFLIKAYQIKFEKEGIDVIIAEDGKAAEAMLEKKPPELVLLDLMLPGVSGFDILEKIKRNALWKDIPVLILSNLGQKQDIERGEKLGAAGYFIKTNMKINDVVNKVKEYIK